MDETRITAVYDAGSMTVRCPDWFYESRPHQRKFYKLLAENRNRSENRQAADDLQMAINDTIRATKAEMEQDPEHSSTHKKRLERLGQVKKDIDEAMEKYGKSKKR